MDIAILRATQSSTTTSTTKLLTLQQWFQGRSYVRQRPFSQKPGMRTLQRPLISALQDVSINLLDCPQWQLRMQARDPR
jgi:hypothetical protein